MAQIRDSGWGGEVVVKAINQPVHSLEKGHSLAELGMNKGKVSKKGKR